MMSLKESNVVCPVCNRGFEPKIIEEHVEKCLFLNTQSVPTNKRSGAEILNVSLRDKKMKLNNIEEREIEETFNNDKKSHKKSSVPLAEQMRPLCLEDLIGQKDALGPGSMIRTLLEDKQIPNMILWGPPGCGKTSLANIISNICKENKNMRYVKLSATMSGINDVKEVVKVAKNEVQFKRKTVLFMDEIHRFNKLQQDTFLPHVESGTITLIGATTENPSFSLNSALLSRCRVVVMQKLSVDDVMNILERSLSRNDDVVIVGDEDDLKNYSSDKSTRWVVSRGALRWVSEVCDGDARVALGALELALSSSEAGGDRPARLTLAHVQDGIKRSHILYDRAGEEHYNTVSALHKSIRAGDDNAALYWCARAVKGGDDPRYIARRLVRAASEDIGLADPSCLVEAVSCAQAVQLIGSPECDVLLAQLSVRLARAPKSTEVYRALGRCNKLLEQGPLPPVPLHLRNAPTSLMKQLGYGRGYNTQARETSGLTYMPDGLENLQLFQPGTEKQRVLRACCNMTHGQEPKQCQLHVLPMRDICCHKLREYLNSMGGAFSEVVAIKPSGWETNKSSNTQKDQVTIHGIPYSEHSSFTELIRFVKFLSPNQVVPTVDIPGGTAAIQKYFPCPVVLSENISQTRISEYFTKKKRESVPVT